MLAAKNVSVWLAGAEALRDISCALEPGKLTVICGPNGAGKSTLLNALAGLDPPTAGQIMLDGEELTKIHPKQRARLIGYLPQHGETAWDVTVEALAGLGRLPHGDAGTAQVAAALEAVALTKFASRPISTLSGGEKSRALLARVLAGQPRWILADEPLAALDLGHQLALLAHLRAAAAAGTGVVLVLHDLALAMNYADRVLVLGKGQLAADGTPQTALSAELIQQVWQVPARWLGEPGARALIAG